jgi:hypothetical protein
MSSSALSRARRRPGFIASGTSAILAIVSFTACGESTGPAGQATELEALTGPDLTGTVGEPLASPIQVKVIDGRGSGVVGAEVEFTASPGGYVETVSSNTDNGLLHLQSITVATNSEGIAATIWNLAERAGAQTITARVDDLPPVEFRALAQPGPPAALVAAAGDKQLGLVGEDLESPLTARLRDSYGNGIAGHSILWELSAGDGELSTQTSQTNESGEATVVVALDATVGLRTVTATFEPLDPAEFVVMGLDVVVRDEVGDTFSWGRSGFVTLPDVVAFGAGWADTVLLVGVTFNDEVSPANVGGPNLMGGNLDFDTDLNRATGEVSAIDVQRRGGEETGMGVDVYVDMFARSSGNFIVFAFSPNFNFVGQITPTFRGELVHFEVPQGWLGTDSLSMALVVATAREATDIAPDNGAAILRRGGN